MRSIYGRTVATVRGFAGRTGDLQGVAGVALIVAGALVLFGQGVALIVAGAFLLFGAWGSR